MFHTIYVRHLTDVAKTAIQTSVAQYSVSAHCRTLCCGNPWTTKIAENRDENEPDLSNNC